MPQSKHRPHHHHQQHQQPHPATPSKGKKRKSLVPPAMIFFSIVGTGIAFFAAGESVIWLIVGLVAGAASGYFFGKQMDNSIAK